MINLVLGRWLLGQRHHSQGPDSLLASHSAPLASSKKRPPVDITTSGRVGRHVHVHVGVYTEVYHLKASRVASGSTISPLHAVSRKGSCSFSDLSSFHVSTGIEFTPPRCQGWLPEGTTSSSAIFHKCWG